MSIVPRRISAFAPAGGCASGRTRACPRAVTVNAASTEIVTVATIRAGLGGVIAGPFAGTRAGRASSAPAGVDILRPFTEAAHVDRTRGLAPQVPHQHGRRGGGWRISRRRSSGSTAHHQARRETVQD